MCGRGTGVPHEKRIHPVVRRLNRLGQVYPEGRTPAHAALDLDLPAVDLDDVLDDGETQAGAAATASECEPAVR